MNCSLTRLLIFPLFIILSLSQSCSRTMADVKNEVTPQDDVVIGRTIDDALMAHINQSNNFSYLSPATHAGAYSYINTIKNKIDSATTNNAVNIASAGTHYSIPSTTSVANTTIRILDKAGETNAFVAPGGYIYLYKDFLNKIQTEAQFAAVLAHLMTCSKGRHASHKMQERFSLSFMIDLALGGEIIPNSGVDISTILNELENVPYSQVLVTELDQSAENVICHLDYEVSSYSNLFTNLGGQNLKWFTLFPRPSLADYATHLFNSNCVGETIGSAAYGSFKLTL